MNHHQKEIVNAAIICGLCGIGIIAGRAAASLAELVLFGVLVAAIITSLFAKGKRRAFAIGFLVPVGLYAALLWQMGPHELQGYHEHRLPTSRLVEYYFMPTNHSSRVAEIRRVHVNRVMPLAHMFTAAVMGYLGGRLARRLHQDNHSTQV